MHKTLYMPPVEDPELKKMHAPRALKLVFPSQGLNKETGLLFLCEDNCIAVDGGYGLNQDKQKIAEEHNLLVASLEAACKRVPMEASADRAFIFNCKQIYKRDLEQEIKSGRVSLNNLDSAMSMGGNLAFLDPRCMLNIKQNLGEYQSWGLLDAVGGLNAVGWLLQDYPLNHHRTYLLGKRYGGYVAHLMAKFAPRTFAAVVDVGGYCKAELRHIVGHATMDSDIDLVYVNDKSGEHFTVRAYFDNPWTIEDEASPFYFDDNKRKIRDLLCGLHYEIESATTYYMFHSKDDPIVDYSDKKELHGLLREKRIAEIAEIEYAAYGASYSQYFNHAMGRNLQNQSAEQLVSDFKRHAKNTFSTGTKKYIWDFCDQEIKIAIIG